MKICGYFLGTPQIAQTGFAITIWNKVPRGESGALMLLIRNRNDDSGTI